MLSLENVSPNSHRADVNTEVFRQNQNAITTSGTVCCSVLKRSRIVSPLGRGGMAEVFLAACEVAPNEHYPVVIKRLYAHFSDDLAAVQMLRDEARLVAELAHRNIVKLYEVGVLNDAHCLVMEYLEGQPLQRLMRSHGQVALIPIELSIHIVMEMLSALDYAHNATDRNNVPLRIIHRDISPQNVFITNDGQIKLLDFGIAKATSHEGRTVTGLVKGKFAYIAPEQAMGQQMDGRADLWSVGVILWELLSGRRLFKADNEAATLRATLRADVPRLAPLRPGISDELERIVARALERHTSMRYATASEMRNDLSKYLSAVDLTPDAGTVAEFMSATFASEIVRQRELLARATDTLVENEKRWSVNPNGVSSYSNVELKDSNVGNTNTTRGAYFTTGSRALGRRAWGAVAVVACLSVACVAGGAVFSMRRSNRDSEGMVGNVLRKRQTPSIGAQIQRADIELSNRETRPFETFNGGQSASVGAIQRIANTNGGAARAVKTTLPQVKPVRSKGGVTNSLANELVRGYLTFDTTPWSNVIIRGKTIGQTPIIRYELPIGTYNLVLSNPELGIETSFPVRITENATTTKRVGLQ